MSRVTAIISALVICIIVYLSWAVNHYRDNASLPTKPSATKMPENWSWRTRQLLTCRCVSVMLLRSMQIHEGVSWCYRNDALRDDVAAGRRRLHIKAVCQPVREATTASAWIMQPPPDWQTPLNGIISPSERGWSLCKKQLEGTQKYINEQCR